MQMLSGFFGGRIISRNSWPPRSPDLSPLDFYLWGFWKRTCKKQPAHKRRIETKYWAMHFKRHCRNSPPGCIKHDEKSECMHRWTRWAFPTLHITLFSAFRFECNLFFGKQYMCHEWDAWLLADSVLYYGRDGSSLIAIFYAIDSTERLK
jgi:hypothetical protein